MFKHKQAMTVKTITITEEAYENIKKLKTKDESFSKLFNRISKKKYKVKDLLGILGTEGLEELRERTKKIREEYSKDITERQHALTRQLRTN